MMAEIVNNGEDGRPPLELKLEDHASSGDNASDAAATATVAASAESGGGGASDDVLDAATSTTTTTEKLLLFPIVAKGIGVVIQQTALEAEV